MDFIWDTYLEDLSVNDILVKLFVFGFIEPRLFIRCECQIYETIKGKSFKELFFASNL